MSAHVARATIGEPASARRKSGGTRGSGSSPAATGENANAAIPPTSIFAALRSVRSTRSQWPPRPSGSRVVRNVTPFMVPTTETIPRDGKALLASAGSTANTHAGGLFPGSAAGLESTDAKRTSIGAGFACFRAGVYFTMVLSHDSDRQAPRAMHHTAFLSSTHDFTNPRRRNALGRRLRFSGR